jgi:hypothetical protein
MKEYNPDIVKPDFTDIIFNGQNYQVRGKICIPKYFNLSITG